VRIHDNWLAQFSAAEAAAILSGYSALGFRLDYLNEERCWVVQPKQEQLPN